MFKKTLIILSTILILFLLIGSIHAADDNSTQLSDVEDSQLSESGYLSYEDSNGLCNPTVVATYVYGSYSSGEYTSGNISYQVKVYDALDYNGTSYNQPKYGATVKLKVYTGGNFKYYISSVGSDGEASFKLPNLSIGNHKIDIYVDNEYRTSSSINVVKSKTTVYAPIQTLKYGKNAYFNIKVVDSHNNIVKNVVLNVKVYTGKRYVTYTVKTNSKGFAKLPTKKLSWGDHKLVIKSNDAKYSVSKSSKVLIRYYVPNEVKTLNVVANSKTVKYKGNDYFYITLKDGYGDAVKSVSMNVKVFTGSKYTTYSVKTDSCGVAKFNTNKLSLGSHKVSISSANKNYKISRGSSIIVKETVVSNEIGPTKLSKLIFYQKGNAYYATVYWVSKKDTSYQILKKSDGDYKIIATVKATSDSMYFKHKVNKDDTFIYSVREIIEKNGEKFFGDYDDGGLKLITNPNVTVDFQNIKASIHWDKVDGATKYQILRKVGRDGKYESLAYVSASKLSYDDYYYESEAELSDMLISKTFIDPNENVLFYTVRACIFEDVGGSNKISYGLYLPDGDFHLEAPDIVSIESNKIIWGKVANAQGYIVLKKDNSTDEWHQISQVTATANTLQSAKLDFVNIDAYYSVQAYANKNGNVVYSLFDEGFSYTNFSTGSDYKVLYLGDSIFYGSPHNTASTRNIFSIPYRVAQLTGCEFYNPSIPGATYAVIKHELSPGQTGYRYSIATEVVDQIYKSDLPGNWEKLGTSINSEGMSYTNLEYYDVVVLAAGPNDFKSDVKLGSINSNDVSTFYGALNHILSKVEKASKNRVNRGEAPIKVVFVDFQYGARLNNFTEIINRDFAVNNIGLSFSDYQKAADKIYNKWQSSKYLTLSNFHSRDYGIVDGTNHPYATTDNLHLTKFSYGQYGNAFANFLVENVF